MTNSIIFKRMIDISITILITSIVLMIPLSSVSASGNKTKTASKTVCGWTFTLKNTFTTKHKMGLNGAKLDYVNYSIKKGKKTTGKIKSIQLAYGGQGTGFYYDKKKKKWRRSFVNDHEYRNFTPNKNHSGIIGAPSSWKYVAWENMGSVGSSFWIQYIPKGSSKMYW